MEQLNLHPIQRGQRRTSAQLERDRVLENMLRNGRRVWADGYRVLARSFLIELKPGARFIGEDLRSYIEPLLGPPHHPNVWGAVSRGVLNNWMRSGNVRLVGLANMTTPRSHARLSPQYVKEIH